MTKTRGFTMVELIIVVAIIAVLASIIMPKMTGARSRSKLAACKQNLKNIAMALEMYANDNNNIFNPTGASYVTISGTGTSSYLFTDGYLKTVPLCPETPVLNSYGIYTPTIGRSYYTYCRAVNQGGAHYDIPSSYPRWDSAKGFIERP